MRLDRADPGPAFVTAARLEPSMRQPTATIWQDGCFPTRHLGERGSTARLLRDAGHPVQEALAGRTCRPWPDAIAPAWPAGWSPAKPLDDIAGDLAHFSVIALNFPKFSDGRAFSTASSAAREACLQGRAARRRQRAVRSDPADAPRRLRHVRGHARADPPGSAGRAHRRGPPALSAGRRHRASGRYAAMAEAHVRADRSSLHLGEVVAAAEMAAADSPFDRPTIIEREHHPVEHRHRRADRDPQRLGDVAAGRLDRNALLGLAEQDAVALRQLGDVGQRSRPRRRSPGTARPVSTAPPP